MSCDDESVGPRLFSVRTVRGEPYQVRGRKLTPVTRIVSLGKASATIRKDRYDGWGGGLMWATPVALLEETGEGAEREIVIHDTTLATLQLLSLVAVTMIFFFAAIRWWVCRRGQVQSD